MLMDQLPPRPTLPEGLDSTVSPTGPTLQKSIKMIITNKKNKVVSQGERQKKERNKATKKNAVSWAVGLVGRRRSDTSQTVQNQHC